MRILASALTAALVVATGACDDDDGENTGQTCAAPEDCYPGVDPAGILGEVRCLDRVPGGYCTHLCETDADCCAAEGECETGIPQLCAPFESTGLRQCFLSCEPDVIGDLEEGDYCHENANEAFLCRSTGGGSENRKVCVPE